MGEGEMQKPGMGEEIQNLKFKMQNL